MKSRSRLIHVKLDPLDITKVSYLVTDNVPLFGNVKGPQMLGLFWRQIHLDQDLVEPSLHLVLIRHGRPSRGGGLQGAHGPNVVTPGHVGHGGPVGRGGAGVAHEAVVVVFTFTVMNN